MFSLRRIANQAILARPAAQAVRYTRPQNVAELNIFSQFLQRRAFSDEAEQPFRSTQFSERPQREQSEYQPREQRDGGDRRTDTRARHQLPPLAPSKVVYVGNLRYETTEEDLIERFKEFGNVVAAKLVRHPDDGRSRGWGYVEFSNLDESSSAIENLNNASFMGRRLSVQFVQRTNLRLKGNDPSSVLFMGNLPFQLTDDDLNELFKDIRGCVDVRVAMDRRTGQPRGFAHADFKDVESAVKAKAQLEGTQIYGRYLRIDYSEHVNNKEEKKTDAPAAVEDAPAAEEKN